MEFIKLLSVLLGLAAAVLNFQTSISKARHLVPLNTTTLALLAILIVCLCALLAICYLGRKG